MPDARKRDVSTRYVNVLTSRTVVDKMRDFVGKTSAVSNTSAPDKLGTFALKLNIVCVYRTIYMSDDAENDGLHSMRSLQQHSRINILA